MSYIEIILAFFIIWVFLLGASLYINWLYNSLKYKVPQVWTFCSDFKVMRKNLWKYNLKWKKIVDLWSWTWKVLRFFEKEYEMFATWYEIDRWNVVMAKMYNYIFGSKSRVIKWNYLKKDLSQFDVIYVYLFPILINDIQDKLWKDCKKWTLIISNAFKFSGLEPLEVFYDEKWVEEMFIYEI